MNRFSLWRPASGSRAALAALALAFTPLAALADVSLPRLISDGVVFQRDRAIRLWGEAEPGEKIAVHLAGRTAHAIAANDRRWSLELDALSAGGPYVLAVQGNNRIEVKDVYLGELWVASGQSNMEWPLRETTGAAEEIAASANEGIRVFKVKRALKDERQTDVSGEWRAASPAASGSFTAVGYYFAKFIQTKLGVPVGIVDSTWGGTPAAAWTPHEDLARDAELEAFITRYEEACRVFPEKNLPYLEKLRAWEAAAGPHPTREQTIAKPQPPIGPGHPSKPSGLFNGMVAPLLPLRVRGVIWYQGESDAPRAATYRKLFPTLIASWRREWQQPDLPFLYVQISGYLAKRDTAAGSPWAELREAQLQTLHVPHTGMAVTIDIGEPNDIHPRNKREVGRRLSLLAREQIYGETLETSGPVLVQAKRAGATWRLRFSHTAGGLKANDGGAIRGFTIAGEDRRFVPAEARVDGDELVVSGALHDPVAVRYAWTESPVATLANAVGLPASPFRTDDWPLVTLAQP
ncbi:MAG: sialate O-acetylesterase [Candidatus Didemnitutus sp.]|nr:sialate O-acetylesterase [Candidatus Didemnitutus sp.]